MSNPRKLREVNITGFRFYWVNDKNGRIEIDQKLCGNAMHGLAVGRKNCLHIGSPEGGPKIATILSVMETCQRLQINLRKY
jgi:hypothetical protein